MGLGIQALENVLYFTFPVPNLFLFVRVERTLLDRPKTYQ